MLKDSRKIAAILAADVVEYSRLMGADEPGTLAALKIRRALFDRLVQEFNGHEFGSVGDSLMAQFPSAINAVRCARNLQHAIAEENDSLPADRRMALRIGVNLGEVIEENGVLFGDGVNIAARLQSLATPGGVLISGSVYEQVKNKLSATFKFLGARPVKNIAEPVPCYEVTQSVAARIDWRPRVLLWIRGDRGKRRVRGVALAVIALLLVLAGGILWRYQRASEGSPTTPPRTATAAFAPPPHSIAVLPFKNYSGDANQEYFADGMTDLLTTELGGIGALTVRSHQSSLKFKGSTKSMPEIGQELHADAVIEGSMLRDGNHITVNVQLIEAPTDRHLWAKKFEGDVINIFKVRNEIVEAIAREIKTTISPEQSLRLSSASAVDPAALQEYLLGRQSWNRQSEKGFAEALEHFNRAKEIDPGFALAWAGVAEVYWGAAPDIAPPEGRANAKAAARRALELDDSLAEAHTALAMLNYAVDYEWGESEREFQRAIRLNSNYAAAHWQYGWLLVYVGRFDEALQEMQRAVELDPLSAVMATDLSAPYTLKRDYAKAIAQCRKALELDPSFFLPHFVLGWIEMRRGANYSKAIEEFHLVQTIETQPMATGSLGYAYARIGQKDKAMETLNELNQLASRRFVSPYHQALVYLGLRENSQAIDWLEKAYEGRSPWLTWLKVEPMFDPLRSDPRFQALYQKMNFPSDH